MDTLNFPYSTAKREIHKTKHKRVKTVYTQLGSVYIAKMYYKYDKTFVGTCKIGFSKNPEKRIHTLNEAWKDSIYSFRLHKASNKLISPDALEGSIHIILTQKNLGVILDGCSGLDGNTEIFKYREEIDWLIPTNP